MGVSRIFCRSRRQRYMGTGNRMLATRALHSTKTLGEGMCETSCRWENNTVLTSSHSSERYSSASTIITLPAPCAGDARPAPLQSFTHLKGIGETYGTWILGIWHSVHISPDSSIPRIDRNRRRFMVVGMSVIETSSRRDLYTLAALIWL